MAFCEQIDEVIKENRHELLIEGQTLENVLMQNNNELPEALFELTQLNYLKLSLSSLASISSNIKDLSNMYNLVLQNNKLKELPAELGYLKKLKLLDLSYNNLESLPQELNNLTELTTVNVGHNLLTELISFEKCTSLGHLDFNFNKIKSLENICHKNLELLTDLNAESNEIEEIPSEISCLVNLKIVNLANNALKETPGEILQCKKLKELNLKVNALSDRRLRKLVESDRGYSKTVIDYIRQHYKATKSAKAGSSKDKKKNKKEPVENEIDTLCDRLSILSASKDSNLTVKIASNVKDIRSHIVCCVINNIDLSGNKMKKFLSIQTKLHEGICEKRVAATIATHDLSKVVGPLTLMAHTPEGILIQPLNKNKVLSARNLFKGLQTEAENVRKQMKKNTYSGIHKFLYLVEGWEKWPCLVDANGTVISLPPITNADSTKISPESKDVFVEVTSSSSINKAKEVMEELLIATLQADLTSDVTENEKRHMHVGQVRILNEDDNPKMVFPSRTDLVIQKDQRITVVRT